jgi:hypothetical protein
MKRNLRRVYTVLASIVVVVLLIGVFGAILMKIENAKYDAHVESAYAKIQSALDSDPNHAMIEVSVETFSVARDMLPMYQPLLAFFPAVRRLGFLKTDRPIKGIVLRARGAGFDPGHFCEKVISPLDMADVPLQIKFSVSN